MAAGPPGKGGPSLGGTRLAQEGEEATATLSAAGTSPRPAADRTKQAVLSAAATVSHPAELDSLLGKCPPALRQAGEPGGCFSRSQAVVGVSGEDVEPGLGPRDCSASDMLWFKF